MRRLVITGLTVAVLLLPCAATAKTVSAFGIKVQRCAAVENAGHTLSDALAGVVCQGETPDLCTRSRVLFVTRKILE
jgi:hypothetical protein